MEKVQVALDKDIKELNLVGEKLKDEIKNNSKEMHEQMSCWQKDQEQYQHQLHNELMLLSDTRNNVDRVNQQIRMLILLQKKTKASQTIIQKEIKDAFKMIERMKGNLVIDEVGQDAVKVNTKNQQQRRMSMPHNRMAAKSQQQAFRHRRNTMETQESSIAGDSRPLTSTRFDGTTTAANDSVLVDHDVDQGSSLESNERKRDIEPQQIRQLTNKELMNQRIKMR